jgi:hypothetical protein
MDTISFPTTSCVTVRPWIDPVVDERGVDPRSVYVERFWLGVLGPTATWVMRRFADEFDRQPTGFRIDLAELASAMGLSYAKGPSSPFGRAVRRCTMFGLALPLSDGFSVRRRIPRVSRHHLRRLPDDLRAAHESWVRATVHLDAHGLERQLIEAGVPPRAAVSASETAARLAR